jgi:hypothetical protein
MRSQTRSVDNSIVWLPGLGDGASMLVSEHQPRTGTIMAKRKKQSKALKRKVATARGNARRKVAKAAMRAKAKPKRAPVKKAARRIKQPVVAAVETVAVEVIEQPAPDVIMVTEVEETKVRKAS